VCLCFSAEEEEEEEEDEEEVKDRSQPRWTVWLDVEPSREAAHWLPWRPDKAKGQSEVDCEDPDRQVGVTNVSCGSSITVCENKTAVYRMCDRFVCLLYLSFSPTVGVV